MSSTANAPWVHSVSYVDDNHLFVIVALFLLYYNLFLSFSSYIYICPSYVYRYGDYENTVSYSYAVRVNTEFQKFGTRGRSILFASGDDGVGCNGNVWFI